MEKRGHRFSPNVEFVRLFDGFAAQRLGIETLERSLKIEMNRVSLTVIEPLVELNFVSTGCRSVSLPPATPSFFRHGSPVAFQAFQVPTVSMIEDSLMHPSDSCQLDDSCVSSIVEIKHLSCCFSSEAFRFWETFALIMRPNW